MFVPESYLEVRKPLLEASTLPPQCYTSPEFFQHELERCFMRHWQFVGRWQLATAENNAICETQYLGQKFPRPPGRFSAAEFAVYALSNWVLDQTMD